MRNAKWIAATALVLAAAGCAEQSGYPSHGYNSGSGYGTPAYGYSNQNNGQPSTFIGRAAQTNQPG